MIRRRIFMAVLLAGLFAVGWWGGRGGSSADLYGNLDLFVEVLHRVEDNYVDTVDPSSLVEGAVKGMLATLDPNSQYLDASGFGGLQDFTEGSFGGIGVEISIRDHFPTVISPIEGTPAWESGIESGDVIVKIGDRATAGFTLEETSKLLRGAPGTAVSLTIAAEGEAPRVVELKRREIVHASVPYAFVLPDGVGYLRLTRFAKDTGTETRRAVERLRAQGAHSLILDLRRNPGGLLDQAVEVAQQFVPRGAEIVSTRGRARGQDRRFYATAERAETQWPMVVLVDEGSASASEVVAGALQDLDRALVIGRTSFGKGSVQNLFTLRGGEAGVKLTTAYYYTPSGRSIHRAAASAPDVDAFEDDDFEAAPDDSVHAGTAPLPAAPDTANRPRFRTRTGRTVFGGGGITPDVAVVSDSLGPLAREIERRGLAMRFARRSAAADKDRPEASLPGVWTEFSGFALDQKLTGDADSLALERPAIERILEREIARRRGGDAAAAKTAAGADPMVAMARQILRRAHTAGEVFALGALPVVPEPQRLEPASEAASKSAAGAKKKRAGARSS